MNYFTKHVSTYSFSGLIYNGSLFVKEEVDQNAIWDGLGFLQCFFRGKQLWLWVDAICGKKCTEVANSGCLTLGTSACTAAVLAGYWAGSVLWFTEELS